MRKLVVVLLAVLCMSSFAAAAEEADFTEQTVKVISGGEERGELALRFYSTAPHIPYMGINEYSRFVRQQPFSVKEQDGICTLKNWNGAEMVCDAQAGSIFVQDWNAFFALPMPLEDKAAGMKDTTVHYARITDITYEGEAKPVTLDFAKYGVVIYADGNDVYLPVSMVSNIMTDIATNHMLYNGENLFLQRFGLGGKGIEGFYDSEVLMAQIHGQERPEDVIRQCYADLCFNFDYFFGHPGKAPLDDAIAQNGLDEALSGLGDEGEEIREGLLSSSLTEYIVSMTKLFMVYLGDGHTFFVSAAIMGQDPAVSSDVEFMGQLSSSGLSILENPILLKQTLSEAIPVQRSLRWGDDTYRAYGNTAIIRLDSFLPDEAGWESYYKGEGELPEDSLGIVVSGLKKASEDPEIENILFDLTCNGGGSPDVMMAVLAMTTGQNQLYGENVLTGQKMTVTFEVDANFDGAYDEKDKEVRYDYNYGVFVTRHAFSCGNLFPIIMQEAGAVLIGEPSSGGSCCIQTGTDIEGSYYLMSSAQWRLTDSEGTVVEGGCSIDLPVEPVTNPLIDSLVAAVGVDDGLPAYVHYYDDEKLDEMMNNWFGDAAQSDLAA